MSRVGSAICADGTSSSAWSSWRRGVDYYDEGELLWLDVDTTIRQLTGDKKTLDDFIHIFHGPPSGPPMVKPFTFDDVVNALNQVAPSDWRKFLLERLNFGAQDELLRFEYAFQRHAHFFVEHCVLGLKIKQRNFHYEYWRLAVGALGS